MSIYYSGEELIEMGIKIEEIGKQFYKAYAKNSKDEKVNKLFLFLAAEEDKHKQKFVEFLDLLEKGEFIISYNDEDVDILGSSTWGDEIAWWENNGNQEFTKHSIDNNFNGAKSVHATDIDGDNDIDVIAAAYYNEIAWWENNGDQEFTKHSIDTSFDGALDVYAIDIDYDKDIDIVATAKCANEVAWFENNGHEEFTKNIIDNSFDNAYDVIATDIDKDGDIDIAAASSDGDEIAWWENNQSIGQNLNVPSGSNATTIWYGLESSTTYYWRVIAKDADGNSALSPIWHFTTSTIIHDDHFQTVPPHSIQPIPP